MRIAFDVKGTIEGPKKKYVLMLLKNLQSKGHHITVWSNLYSYAVDAVKDNHLDCEFDSKRTTGDCADDASRLMDLAIDDDSSQTWLASKRFIWVHDIPETDELINELAERITNENWDNTKCQGNRYLSRTL